MRISWLKKVAVSPSSYAYWTVFVVLSLIESHLIDPYVFGLATLILGWLSLFIVSVGVTVMIAAKPLTVRTRVVIGLSLAVVATAVVTALSTLQTFKWA